MSESSMITCSLQPIHGGFGLANGSSLPWLLSFQLPTPSPDVPVKTAAEASKMTFLSLLLFFPQPNSHQEPGKTS